MDLALLKPPKSLSPVEIGGIAEPGDKVFAIGYGSPFGFSSNPLITHGFVCKVARY